MTTIVIPDKFHCQMFKSATSHWGNKGFKRCKSIAIKEFNGKQYCVNCFVKVSQRKSA